MLKESTPEQKSVLQEFYRGTSVFVTGGSGFMGKVLVEKLLRSCPDIARIYLLLRPKRGRKVEERVDDLLSSPCFKIVLKENPKIKSKLVAVSGDIGLVGLGLSDSDQRLLREHVDVVFNMAATVRFNEPLKVAILQNVRGTREVLALCRTFAKLKSVIHISTAYSHCPRSSIDEVMYDAPIDSDTAIKMAESSDADKLDQQATSLLGKWPNTYSFSKAISEHAVKFYGQGLPVGIVRPSVVVSCAREPVPGWCDSLYGPMGSSVALATGVAKTLYVKPDGLCNFVPCDLANNCIIAAAWDVSNRKLQTTPVYNCVTPKENNLLSWHKAYHALIQQVNEVPPTQSIWYISCLFTSSRLLTIVLRFLLHFLPALIIDTFTYASSGKTRMVRMYKELHKFIDACFYFSSHSWPFEVKQVDNMRHKLGSTDRRLFPFDFRAVDWDRFGTVYWNGIKTYLLKDTIESLPRAKKRLHNMYLIHRLTQCLLGAVAIWLVWFALQCSNYVTCVVF